MDSFPISDNLLNRLKNLHDIHNAEVEDMTNIPVEKIWDEIKTNGPTNPRFSSEKPNFFYRDSFSDFMKREIFVKEYSWGIPSKEAIDSIKEFIGSDSILEIGSGSGLWARLLLDSGVKIYPTDSMNEKFVKKYMTIEKLSANEAVDKFNGICNVAMLCWSRVRLPESFTGKKYIYIGELPDGCTSGYPDDDSEWNLVKTIELPQWWGIHDDLFLFQRD